ncbi:DUF4136 domain-containing protein [Cecembia sp.]|uniref:DUF4136 domain-containing protein n=1 Tax=Cecembia sp. TaxID=1898110 RepID=UPI0025BF24FF|nr:DUF4136 domain-containing protein [Cecembia sp.]
MKAPFPLILVVILVLLASCVGQKDYVAEYDFNYTGNFKRYKTFDFVGSEIPKDSIGFYQTIERTISNRLGSQGFKQENEKPDLLINYMIFNDQVKYRGYDQPNFDYWVERRSELIDMEKLAEAEQRERDETYNNVRYLENNGMLVIYVIDNKRGNTIWQGYAPAVFDFLSPDIQSDLTRATYRVMDQFRILSRR